MANETRISKVEKVEHTGVNITSYLKGIHSCNDSCDDSLITAHYQQVKTHQISINRSAAEKIEYEYSNKSWTE